MTTKLTEKEVKAFGGDMIRNTIEPIMAAAIEKIIEVADNSFPDKFDKEDREAAHYANLSMAMGEIAQRLGKNCKDERMNEDQFIGAISHTMQVLMGSFQRGYND